MIWDWYGTCPSDDSIDLRVTLDGQRVYSAIIPVCRKRFSEAKSESPQRILKFPVQVHGQAFGAEFKELGLTDFKGNIWLAGVEPTGLLLGVSFATPNRIVMNKLHMALPSRTQRSVLAKGLVLVTSRRIQRKSTK